MSKNKNKNSYLLIANGDVTPELIEKVDLSSIAKIIAADGGAAKALACDVTPDVVIGDFDSLPAGFQHANTKMQFIHKPSQEAYDLEKALHFCEQEGATHVTLLGVTGDRVDHTMNNFSLLAKFDQKLNMSIFCPQGQIFLVRDELSVAVQVGQTISLIPIGRVEGVVTEGLEFQLKNEVLMPGEREGAGNRAIAGHIRIFLKSGLLLVFVNDMK